MALHTEDQEEARSAEKVRSRKSPRLVRTEVRPFVRPSLALSPNLIEFLQRFLSSPFALAIYRTPRESELEITGGGDTSPPLSRWSRAPLVGRLKHNYASGSSRGRPKDFSPRKEEDKKEKGKINNRKPPQEPQVTDSERRVALDARTCAKAQEPREKAFHASGSAFYFRRRGRGGKARRGRSG